MGLALHTLAEVLVEGVSGALAILPLAQQSILQGVLNIAWQKYVQSFQWLCWRALMLSAH